MHTHMYDVYAHISDNNTRYYCR